MLREEDIPGLCRLYWRIQMRRFEPALSMVDPSWPAWLGEQTQLGIVGARTQWTRAWWETFQGQRSLGKVECYMVKSCVDGRFVWRDASRCAEWSPIRICQAISRGSDNSFTAKLTLNTYRHWAAWKSRSLSGWSWSGAHCKSLWPSWWDLSS